MPKTIFLLCFAIATLTANAKELVGCQLEDSADPTGFAHIYIDGDKNQRIDFGSLKSCQSQIDYLKAQPFGIVCGCGTIQRPMNALDIFLFGGIFSVNEVEKGIRCWQRDNHDESEYVRISEVKIQGNSTAVFKTIFQKDNEGNQAVLKACLNNESTAFNKLKTEPAASFVLTTSDQAAAAQ